MSSFAAKFCGFWQRFFSHGRVRVGAQLRRVGARALEAEHHVVGGERRAVVELHAGPQLEAPGRRIHLGPRLGERRDERQLLVAHHQELVDLRVDVVGEVLVLRMGIGGLHVAAACPAQRHRVGIHGADTDDGRERDDREVMETHGGYLRERARGAARRHHTHGR
jgi:hypothetical protein